MPQQGCLHKIRDNKPQMVELMNHQKDTSEKSEKTDLENTESAQQTSLDLEKRSNSLKTENLILGSCVAVGISHYEVNQ